ncbi:Trk system potassium transporter TrkA [Granulosicoccus antarcticus]|uniref:Trk system potassium uptake protein TrkA n=1 Tax=Granulosicoccus antarcticus IMCC3135 TaxID=1192854 RepID=A0A2Z2NI51_9GAMM|nr:Trk system potassium transporter TrkA [Granulosicoccus antarcticus]ASJ71002.1 Trk system potassium uptake protein TrkA [Granulosicoccus antarcticus IMCC3135]
MKIIVLGAGQVGAGIAVEMANEANDLTVVDQNPVLLKKLQDRLDIRTVVGNASSPTTLIDAGIEDADLLLAVTSRDETNMVACQVAHSLFSTQKCLARIRSTDYLQYPALFSPTAVPVDYIISPEKLVTRHIQHLIEEPGVLQVLDFIDGRARMAAVEAKSAGSLLGVRLRDLPSYMPDHEFRVVAVFRDNTSIQLDGQTRIQVGDEVFFIAACEDIAAILVGFRESGKRYKRIIIAGGGNIGEKLALSLENNYQVKLIEIDEAHALHMAKTLQNSIVLLGDAADADLLKQENIENTDVYCAVTNDDEANILSSMLAKRLGARKTLCLINRSSYVDIAQGSAIDIAVSPAQITIGALLAHIRRGDVLAVHSLRRGAAEAIEIKVHGDRQTSRAVGRSIGKLSMPEGVSIGLIARGEQLVFPHKDVCIESGDHIVIFLTDKRRIKDVERLFQVGVTFV